jgi:membrane fusion protein (multidrug efflux system)
VFVVEPAPNGKPGKIAQQRFVRAGEMRGDFVAIDNGLTGGEEIVSAGAFKLRNGAPIAIDNSVVPAASIAPKPENR